LKYVNITLIADLALKALSAVTVFRVDRLLFTFRRSGLDGGKFQFQMDLPWRERRVVRELDTKPKC